MSIACAIETTWRPGGHDYLKQTLENWHRSTGLPENVRPSVVHGGGWTRQQNGMRALQRACFYAREGGASWVMKLEDDLDFCDDFMGSVERWLETVQSADASIFSLGYTFQRVSESKFNVNERGHALRPEGPTIFDKFPPEVERSFPVVHRHLARGDHFVAVPTGAFWGAQAIVMRVDAAEELVQWMGPDPFFNDGREEHRQRGHDLLLQQWMRERGDRWFVAAVPSFVQHIGEHSNLSTEQHTQPFFQFPFAGRDWRFR